MLAQWIFTLFLVTSLIGGQQSVLRAEQEGQQPSKSDDRSVDRNALSLLSSVERALFLRLGQRRVFDGESWSPVHRSASLQGTSPSKGRSKKGWLILSIAGFVAAGAGAYLYSTWDGTTTPTGTCYGPGPVVTCYNLGAENGRRDGGLFLMILGGLTGGLGAYAYAIR